MKWIYFTILVMFLAIVVTHRSCIDNSSVDQIDVEQKVDKLKRLIVDFSHALCKGEEKSIYQFLDFQNHDQHILLTAVLHNFKEAKKFREIVKINFGEEGWKRLGADKDRDNGATLFYPEAIHIEDLSLLEIDDHHGKFLLISSDQVIVLTCIDDRWFIEFDSILDAGSNIQLLAKTFHFSANLLSQLSSQITQQTSIKVIRLELDRLIKLALFNIEPDCKLHLNWREGVER